MAVPSGAGVNGRRRVLWRRGVTEEAARLLIMENLSRTQCPECGLEQIAPPVAKSQSLSCCRCGARLRPYDRMSVAKTIAFTLAALVLYFPANFFPILRMDYLGAYSETTLWEGSLRLLETGDWPVALVVFFASIVAPFLKLVGLLALCGHHWLGSGILRKAQLYRFLERIGPWAMLDVFLVAILVAWVKMGKMATVMSGPGLIAFAGVVVFTLLATQHFDPRIFLKEQDDRI